jgi:hypothetical protein
MTPSILYVMVLLWKGKRLVEMVSALHSSQHINIMKKNGRANEDINKPHCVVEQN